MSENIANNSELREPPTYLLQSRLESALHTAYALAPEGTSREGGGLDRLKEYGPSYYLFADCENAFLNENWEKERYARTERDSLNLHISATVMLMYWQRVHPRPAIPQRGHLEYFFRRTNFNEAQAVSPLMEACAADIILDTPEATALEQTQTRGITTLAGMEELLTNHPDRLRIPHYLHVLKPLVTTLGNQLQQEGHTPYDWQYFLSLRDKHKESNNP